MSDDAISLSRDAETPATALARLGPLFAAAFVGLVVCTNIAHASFAALDDENPLGLLLLSSRNRYLVLTAPSGISPVAWGLAAALRLGVAAIVCHMVGRCYGDRALRWFWKFLGMPPEQVARFEQGVARYEWAFVPVFVGSNIVWALTGAASTTWRRLLPMFVTGVAVRLAIIWWLAQAFEEQLQTVIDWVNEYQLWIVLASVALVVSSNLRNFRRGR